MSLRIVKRFTALVMAALLLFATTADAATLSAPLIAREMLKSLNTVNTLAFSGEVSVESATTYSAKLKKEYSFYEDSKMNRAVTFSGFIDGTDEEQGKIYMNFDIPDYVKGGNQGNLQMIVLEKDLYFNLTSDSLFEMIKGLGFDLTSINGQWIGINEESLKKFFTETLGENPDNLNSSFGLTNRANELSPAQSKATLKALKDSGVMSFVKVADKTADANGLYHLRININKNKVVPLVQKLMKVTGEKALTAAELRALKRKITQWQMPKVDILVDKVDYLPRTFTYSATSKQTYSYGSTVITTTKLTLELSGYNMPVSIVAPSTFKPFEQVYTEIKAQMERESRDSSRISDLRQIQTALELYYEDQGSDPAGAQVVLGSGNAACLNASGWQPSGCAEPYLSWVPADPGTGSYVYTRVDMATDTTYVVDATLEGTSRSYEWNDATGAYDYITLMGKIRLTPDAIVNR